MEDILYRNISLHKVITAFEITLNYHKGLQPTNATATPILRNVKFEQITAVDSDTLFAIDGIIDSVISNLTFTNVNGIGSKTVIGIHAIMLVGNALDL